MGGTVQIIVNNLIGFTSVPAELQSTRYASDIAKRLPIPIFHVNAEDPDAVVRVGRLALEYRYAFGSDVVVDLIGYPPSRSQRSGRSHHHPAAPVQKN